MRLLKQRRPARAFLWLAICCAAMCARTSATPTPGYWASSDSSQYSPVARLLVQSRLEGRTLSLVVDTGYIAIPGDPVSYAPPLMSNLYLTAIVAEADSGTLTVVRAGAGRHPGDRRGWRPVATSDSVLLAAELRYGERRPLSKIQLAIPNVQVSGERPTWVIFRISGNTVELFAPLAPGAQPRRHDLPGGVQVYACGSHDLRGRLDSARTAELRRAYGIAC